jgi:hypothetical protein
MRAALLTLAVIGSQSVTLVSQRVPDIDVEKLCRSRSADDKIMQEPQAQRVPDCVREENDAKQELIKLWAQTDSSIRDICEDEAAALGTRTYLDLLSCLQMADDLKPASKGRLKSK